MAELRQTFRPEFLNRIDDIIVFRALTEQDIEEVARRMLKTVADRMETMGIHLDAGDAAVKELAKEAVAYGADEVYVCDDEQLKNYRTDAYTRVLEDLVKGKEPGILLLPATTALATIDGDGRIKAMNAGCNVVMPNLSPMAVRQKYLLYDNKAGIGDDGESSLRKLRAQMQEIGYEVAVGRGDYTDGRTKQ